MVFQILILIISAIAAAIASIAGFGIGSLITPLMTAKTGIGVAVAGVSIAHFFGTLLRFIFWRKYINRRILLSFGLASAAGGLIGALLHNALFNEILTFIFAGLLIFAGITGLTGLSEKMRFSGAMTWMAGALSGFFGGLVGNQGGIRSASMLGFKLSQKEFVATSTGIALIVDLVRMPVYLVTQAAEIFAIWQFILIATVGVFVGTSFGFWALKKIPEKSFKKVVSLIILLIGIYLFIQPRN